MIKMLANVSSCSVCLENIVYFSHCKQVIGQERRRRRRRRRERERERESFLEKEIRKDLFPSYLLRESPDIL